MIRVVLQNHTIVYVQRNKLRGVSGKGEDPFLFEYQIDYEREYKMSFLKSVLQKQFDVKIYITLLLLLTDLFTRSDTVD